MKKLFLFFVFLIPFTLNSDENILNFLQKHKWEPTIKVSIKSYYTYEFHKDKIIEIFNDDAYDIRNIDTLHILKHLIKNDIIVFSVIEKHIVFDENNNQYLQLANILLSIRKLSDKTILLHKQYYPDGEETTGIYKIYE